MNMKSIIPFLLVLLIYSCGTDQGDTTTYEYSARNDSGTGIEVRSYISYLPEVAPIITVIPSGEEVTKTFKDGLPPSGYSFKSFFGDNPNRDSIKVIYNNERASIFTDSCTNERNPLNNCIYRNEQEIFTFTEEDLQNASDCQGSCD
jgi:hypothetical protein